MVEVQVSYLGDLRCEATHGPSSTKLVTDAPVDNMGKGQSFSPTDLVATALATCIVTTMAIVAQRHNIELRGTRAKVTKEMQTTPIRRIARLAVEIQVPIALPEEHRTRLENAAHSCPVHKSLHPDVQAPITFKWGE